MNEITVLAPATVANVVCGFDCLGFCLEEPNDLMTLRLINEKTIKIKHLDNYDLPTQPEKNVAGKALLAVLDKIEENVGFEVEITKRIMPGSGIGSSAASAAGAVVAANILLGKRFSRNELVELAMQGEMVASGAKHADNIAPCVLGGFTLVRSVEPMDVISIDYPPLFATIIHPQIEIKTSYAREILPKEVPLKSAIRQWSDVGSLIAGLQKGDYDLIARSLQDFIVEPVRKTLIPHFDELKTESLKAGALGGGISGAGPSVFMFSQNRETAEKVGAKMSEVYSQTEIDFNIYVSPINKHGVVKQ
ncbi:MAG TPA: homoserine kinase [Pyrinomonadaceae bacterium]|nr:homoserine kinase [Pyrinomonadaceae bacterium]